MKKGLVLKIIFSLIALAIVGIGVIVTINLSKSKYDGLFELYIDIPDTDKDYDNKKLGFNEGDTLFDVMKRTFKEEEFVTNDTGYGAYVTKLLTLEESYDESGMYYISFYINGEYATTGISSTPLHEGDIIKFELARYNYE